jgi:hypothetical protein
MFLQPLRSGGVAFVAGPLDRQLLPVRAVVVRVTWTRIGALLSESFLTTNVTDTSRVGYLLHLSIGPTPAVSATI